MFTFNKTFIAAALHNICRVYIRKAFKVQRTAIFQLLCLYYGALPHKTPVMAIISTAPLHLNP